MFKALIVFFEVPDSVKLLEIEVQEEELEKLRGFHNSFMDVCAEGKSKEINDYFYDDEGKLLPKFKELLGSAPNPRNYDLLIITGMYL